MNLYLVQPRRRSKAVPAKGRLLTGNVFPAGRHARIPALCDCQRALRATTQSVRSTQSP